MAVAGDGPTHGLHIHDTDAASYMHSVLFQAEVRADTAHKAPADMLHAPSLLHFTQPSPLSLPMSDL
jgi:hypothetical protein